MHTRTHGRKRFILAFAGVMVFAFVFVRYAEGWTSPTENPPGGVGIGGSGGLIGGSGARGRNIGANQLAPAEGLHISGGSLKLPGFSNVFEFVSGIMHSAYADNVEVTGSTEIGRFTATKPVSVYGKTLFQGDVGISGSGLIVQGDVSAPVKNFVIPHPLRPGRALLRHAVMEAPELENWYDGTAILNAKGEATIQLPDYFEALNRDYRYQLFPIGAPAPGLYIKEKIKNNRFVIAGGAPFGARASAHC